MPTATAKIAKAQQAYGSQARSGLPDCGHGFVLLEEITTHEILIIPMRCKRWDCSYCAPIKLARAQALARAGHPTRHMVLTLKPRPGESLRAQVKFLRSRFRLIVERIRRTHGPLEYMASLELQKNGTPHLHVLYRGPYMSQRWLSQHWLKLTGAWNVHLKAVKREANAINEITKYLAKTAAALAAELPNTAVLTTSNGWEVDPPGKDPTYSEKHFVSLFCPFSPSGLKDALDLLGSALVPSADSPGLYTVAPRPPPTNLEYDEARALWPAYESDVLELAYTLMVDRSPVIRYAALVDAERGPT